MHHRRTRSSWLFPALLMLAIVAPLLLAAPARADGIIIVEPPGCDPVCPGPVRIGDQLVVRSHRVDVAIADQVAVTRIDQVFHNPNDWAAEGTYIFPVPVDAAIADFAMWVDGERIEANLLDAEEARRIYDEIVRELRDPALLEYIGTGAIQASVFPIPPGEDRRIEIEYGQVIPAEQGLSRYLYPLNTERFSARPLEQVSVRVEVESEAPVRAIYSPSHDIAISREDDFHFVAGYEATDVHPATDFELFYNVSPDLVGANLVSYYDPVTNEGYFMLLAAPGIERASDDEVIAKDVVIVLDTSGSMEGEKIVQAKAALSYVLTHLNPEDRFNIVRFSTGANDYAPDLAPAAEAGEAIAWIERQEANGGTDINLALLNGLAMVEPERPTILLFLTDGLATEGEVETPRILDNVARAAPANVRLFPFGVGDDVDTILLDSLAQAHQGRTTYVRPGQDLEEAVSAFYGSVSTPVLADLELELAGPRVEDVYPQPLPDLFAGTQLVVLGRYHQSGPVTVTLRGEVNGEPQTFVYEGQELRASGGHDFLPRLWATRRIGYLLNQIRLNGENPELVSAVVDLSVRFGIVTPYTSYLITEDDILTRAGRERASAGAADEMAAPAPVSGVQAVDRAQAVSEFEAADSAVLPQATITMGSGDSIAVADVVRTVGARAFVLQDDVWIETTFDPSTMETTKVAFLSDEYFDLLSTNPDLADAFALGDQVIAISDGVAYEVVPE
ncbi:MAG: VWA domain-containing protein [Chloroflexota bacterium]|nr:VWA domain-containing protein [Chloroflexota bacterium]